jgi:hypothetical protein
VDLDLFLADTKKFPVIIERTDELFNGKSPVILPETVIDFYSFTFPVILGLILDFSWQINTFSGYYDWI